MVTRRNTLQGESYRDVVKTDAQRSSACRHRYGAELVEHPELVEGIPRFSDLPVLDAQEHHPGERGSSVRRGKSQGMPAVRSLPAPARSDDVAFADDFIDIEADVGKCRAVGSVERLEP